MNVPNQARRARIQLALNVDNLDEAIDFYGRVFGVAAHKLRPGYANFEIDEVGLKLVLFEKPGAPRLDHLGVEVFDDAVVDAWGRRLASAGLDTTVEKEEVCCFAEQNKVFTHDPQGLRWEWYRITDDLLDEQASGQAGSDMTLSDSAPQPGGNALASSGTTACCTRAIHQPLCCPT